VFASQIRRDALLALQTRPLTITQQVFNPQKLLLLLCVREALDTAMAPIMVKAQASVLATDPAGDQGYPDFP
jgi:hypothetical protein